MKYLFDCFFFFQAEDGIRDKLVTGVQTCALPIYGYVFAENFQRFEDRREGEISSFFVGHPKMLVGAPLRAAGIPVHDLDASETAYRRSEERRVGKEGRSGW